MIPLFKPYVSKKEMAAIVRVLHSNKLTRGVEVEKFEKAYAAYTKQKYAIAVNSGTSGLHLAVRAMGWKKGDEVITTPFSFIASANALLFENVTPVFVDIDPATLNIDIAHIEEKITPRTKGILLVHLFGLPVEERGIRKLQKKYNLDIIEDACETMGRPDDTLTVTRLGAMSVYSFHENKELTTAGEGGMITTNDPILAQKCRAMREHGRSLQKNWLDNVILGFNFRMTEMQAAFGDAQLTSLDMITKKSRRTAQKYSSLLTGIPGITTQHMLGRDKTNSFAYFILFDNSSDRDTVHAALSRADIGSSTNYFPPIHKFPQHKKYARGTYPQTDFASKRLLVLPLFYEITDEQIRTVVATIKKALQ